MTKGIASKAKPKDMGTKIGIMANLLQSTDFSSTMFLSYLKPLPPVENRSYWIVINESIPQI